MTNQSTQPAAMWWDGGERAITAREKALIEEHSPSRFTIPLLPAEAVDPADPWRGLYLPTRMPAASEYGDLTHPDIPRWPDDREDALDKLVHAQGFDFHIVVGDFTEAALEDGDELYWQEMRAWNPEAPEGEWRLAWKGDTEDGPYAWFVRPMALRPETVAPPAQGIDLAQFRGWLCTTPDGAAAEWTTMEDSRARFERLGRTIEPVFAAGRLGQSTRTDHLLDRRNRLMNSYGNSAREDAAIDQQIARIDAELAGLQQVEAPGVDHG